MNNNQPLSCFSALTPAELERLAILAEECGEVVQIIGKILRHGYDSYNPFDENKTKNRALLEKELGDIQAVVEMMHSYNDINHHKIIQHRIYKEVSIKQYLHHQ